MLLVELLVDTGEGGSIHGRAVIVNGTNQTKTRLVAPLSKELKGIIPGIRLLEPATAQNALS